VVSKFDPPADTNIAKEYEEREVLGALYEKLAATCLLDDKQRTVLQLTYERNLPEREIADILGYKSKTQVVRIREKALSILREGLKSFQD
jgi:DNA-directed RNA polymerase specialized sigma subunit